MESPDEELAAALAARLVERGLIETGRLAEATEKIAAGTASADDWRLWIEFGWAARTRARDDDDAED